MIITNKNIIGVIVNKRKFLFIATDIYNKKAADYLIKKSAAFLYSLIATLGKKDLPYYRYIIILLHVLHKNRREYRF